MALFQRTKILSNSIWIRYLSSSDITLRHVNPFRLKKDQIVQEIFTQLQPKYLPQEPKVDTKEMNKIMDQFKANLNEDDKCLEIYKSYGQNSKLAFYLLANPDLKPDFLVKLVKHMSSIQTSADAQDMVALWLTLYMTKKLWNVEELYENFDFTKFQFSLSNLLEKRQISSLELQLIFHGMKRVQGLNLYHPVLRKSLYKYLINCAIVNEEHCEELILTILPIMQRSDEIQKDDKKLIFQLLHAFASISSKLSITALIQIVNYGISKKDDVYDGLIHEELINRIQSGDLKFLSVNEIKKLTKYLSRIPEEIDGSISQLICNELELVQDEDCQLTDTRDIVHSLCYLALSFDTVSVKLVSKIFEAVNSVSSNELKSKLPKELSKELLFVVHQNLFPQSAKKLVNLEEQFKSHFVGVSDSFFCRLLVNIQQPLLILNPELSEEIGHINPTLSAQLLHLTQKRIPLEDLILQKNLSHRQKQLIHVQSIISDQLGNKDYVAIFYGLPHAQEPDLVFGHFAGIPLSIPEELIEGKPCPELGEWSIISVAPVSKSKRKQLNYLGYKVYDLSGQSIGGIHKKNVLKMVASILTGNVHDEVNPNKVPL